MMLRQNLRIISCGLALTLALGLLRSSPAHADLVAHWKLDEGQGDTFADSAGNNNGFLQGGATIGWVTDAPPGQASAVRFSGTNSWIQTDFPGIGGTDPRTVACWIKTTSTDNNGGIIGWGPTVDTQKWHIRLNSNPGDGVFGAFRSEVGGGQEVAGTAVNDGVWHHVVAVLPGGGTKTSDMLHYVDGVLDPQSGGREQDVNTDIGPNAARVTIGARDQAGNLRFFDGLIADVRIYDEALDAATIRALATADRCFAVRTFDRPHAVPGETVTVTLEAGNLGGGATIADTFPMGWTVENPTGTVQNNTITFQLAGDGTVSYTLRVPTDFCGTTGFSGTFTAGCDSRVLGSSILGVTFANATTRDLCAGTGGIAIEGDEFDRFVSFNSVEALPEIVVTEPDPDNPAGARTLWLPAPNGEKFAVYAVNVTALPNPDGQGRERFPIAVVVRTMGDDDVGMGIRNLTIDDQPPDVQNSFISVYFDDSNEGNRIAIDDLGVGDDSTVIPGTRRDNNPGRSLDEVAMTLVKTVGATLELQMGLNLLRIDGTETPRLPQYRPDLGWQALSIRIGPDEPGLQGELVPVCNVQRRLNTSFFENQPTVVKLAVRGLSGATTITETFPADWSVLDSGGGQVNGNQITFTVTQLEPTELSYSLLPPDGFCDTISLSGTYAGPGECSGEVGGDGSIGCVPTPSGAVVFDFDTTGPTTDAELPDFFDFLGVDAFVGPDPGWNIRLNDVNPADPTNALHTASDGNVLETWFSRVAILKPTVFEAQDFFFSTNLTFDDDDNAGVFFRFNGRSDVPLDNSFYFLRINACGNNSIVRIHKIRDGNSGVIVRAPDDAPFIICQGATVTVTVQAIGNEIRVWLNGQAVPGMDPYIDEVDPILRCGAIGVGQRGSPSFFDRLTVADLGDVPCPCSAFRTLPASRYEPGDAVTVRLDVRNLTGTTTVEETFPPGLQVLDSGGGQVRDNTLAFTLETDGEIAYTLGIPEDFCDDLVFTGTLAGDANCADEVISGNSIMTCVQGCFLLRDSGAPREMLIIGPIDLGGDPGANCDDSGRLETTDYLAGRNFTSGTAIDEKTIQVLLGDELKPDFGGAAGGAGVGAAGNPEINPRASEGVLTVWLADTNASGRINFTNDDNVDSLDNYLVYAIVYLENRTGGELRVTLRVGSADAVKVLLNGQPAHVNAVCRDLPAEFDSDRVPATLEPGVNTLVMAVVQRTGDTDLRLQIYDEFDTLPIYDSVGVIPELQQREDLVACLSPGDREVVPEVCNNQLDDDSDGRTDCDDPDCADEPGCQGTPFVRGNVDAQGMINISDPIFLLSWLFQGGREPPCLEAGNVDGQGSINISDPIYLLSWLFQGGTEPPPPFPDCDILAGSDCKSFDLCP